MYARVGSFQTSMSYSIRQLAALANISSRTLRHYDAVGLLTPSSIGKNGYRFYEHADLLRLQNILFYRELDFSLDEIKRILMGTDFDILSSLAYQKRLLENKRKRLSTIISTINKTIHSMKNNEPLKDEELYEGLTSKEIQSRKQEAAELYGHTDAYKESQKRVARFTRTDWQSIKVDAQKNIEALAKLKRSGADPTSPAVQEEIVHHHAGIQRFYDCTRQIYLGLADLYVTDPRFRKNYDDHEEGLAEFLSTGMKEFAKHLP